MSVSVIGRPPGQCQRARIPQFASNANGAGIAASPTLACGCPGRVWAIAFPGVVGGATAVMHVRAPRVPSHRGCQHRDAHRIGSGWFRSCPVSRLGLPPACCLFIRWPQRAGVPRPAHPPASGPVRRLVWIRRPSPSTWRFRDRPSTGRSGSSVPRRRSVTSLPSFPTAAGRSDGSAPLAASAVREVCSGERSKRVFRRCCGHRCRIDQLQFSLSISTVSRRNFEFGFIVSTRGCCDSKPSRASGICMSYPQTRRIAVDKSVDCRQWLGFCAAKEI